MPKILYVEDDKDLATMVKEWLVGENFTLELVHDGALGWEYLRQGDYDLIILDWELPGMSGVEILKRYRNMSGMTPVLMLTGRGHVENKEQGFDAGADDYLTKPFAMKELSARLRALMRRPAMMVSNAIKVGDLELDPTKHTVTKAGQPLHLLPKDFSLLEFFMRNPDKVYSTEALMMRVWNADSESGTDALRTAIKRLRKALDGDTAESDSMIENIPRIGYRLKSR
ncbi:MAG TPA: response regulator transcription factor [Candidatus Obscuribacter sp.]|nr:response regulator transcription factor [Candidatus Melainabacteria bacterium]MBK8221479.1 response regulator transcription factor [Candidatus Obscuribacter sp.]MBL8085861.1 response regulator transcription factor [Candidatus Obscuribacter sp.]MDX1989502.1 response regulator transcription factor [Candidatus Obscuribacter sp.]HMW90236.1 response regulator transcription factor [Candidatus Obscuribacter sp.]